MKLGYQVKQDKAHQAVIRLIKNNPMTAKEIAEIRCTNQNSTCSLLNVMQGKGLVKKYQTVKIGTHESVLWVATEQRKIDIKPKNVYEFNLTLMAA